jgi:hypothetical protein
MPLTIHCYEPQSQPRQISLVLEKAMPFAVYALQDTLGEDARDLRSTVLRRVDELPPPTSTLLFEVEVRNARPGELPALRVHKAGGRASIEMIRIDSRARVVRNMDFKSGARFEATLGDLRTVMFSLEIETEKASGKAAMAGARPTGSQAVSSVGSLIWVVPTIVETLTAPGGKLVAWLVARAKKAGISPQIISPLVLSSAFLFGALYFAYDQYKEGQTAQERLKALEIEFLGVQAARADAVAAEEECRSQRKDLVYQLGEIEESRRLQAEIALAKPLAHAIAFEDGGSRMADEATLEWDKPAWEATRKLIVLEMAEAREPLSTGTRCLAQNERLGQDLPMFALMWHPSPEVSCPEDFSAVIDGVDMAGPWGLSQRVARDFGGITDLPDGVDPRKNERWAAAALTAGLRAVMETILTADTGGRPPVAPGQLHLWTVALFDAYNRMPSPASGSMDRRPEECIRELVEDVAGRYKPAEPGQPALPPIDNVASGEEFKVAPTSGCPWPSTAMSLGASAAVRAVRELALVQLKRDEEDAGGAAAEDDG